MEHRNPERAPLGTDERLAQDLLKSGLPLRVESLEARVRGCERATIYLALTIMVATVAWGVGEYMEDPSPEAAPVVSIPAVLYVQPPADQPSPVRSPLRDARVR